MAAKILDGKYVSQQIRRNISLKVSEIKKEHQLTPGLAVILVGEDSASKIYIKHKMKACEEVGIHSQVHHLDKNIREDQVLKKIESLNSDEATHGILVQLPLPDYLRKDRILSAIAPQKDVDGLHPTNAGKLFLGQDGGVIPCTPKGIITLLKWYDVEIKGKNAVIIGRSNIVGKPVGMLLLKNDATVTYCHSKTVGLADIAKKADILVAALGKSGFVDSSMVNNQSVVIDVGVNRINNKIIGDVNFEEVQDIASMITPVPGGIGPMTIAMLLANTVEEAKKQLNH